MTNTISMTNVSKYGLDDALAAGLLLPDLEALIVDTLPGRAPDDPTTDDQSPGPMEPGDVLLDELLAFLGRFVAYPSPHAQIAHTLWIAHTHLMDAWESTPRLAFLSPEPASGKTRALEITELLTPNPVEAVNVTPAYLFRKVGDDDAKPTILFDEIDTVFGPKAKENEEIRGLLNAGHRRGAVAGRCVVRGKTVETEEISAFCAVAVAGLGGLPDTILSRSIVVKMRRRATTERVASYRRRVESPAGHAIRDRLGAWAGTVRDRVTDAWPTMPTGIEDRDSDVWEPLLAVADAAGGNWPKRARVAAVALVADSKENTPSLGIRLLADLRQVFGDRDQMSGHDLLNALIALDEAPWGELAGGRPLNARGLARRLGEYGVKSKVIRIGETTPRGYTRLDLADAWTRYLPSPEKSATSATSATFIPAKSENPRGFGHSRSAALWRTAGTQSATSATNTPRSATFATQNPHESGNVAAVALVADLAGHGGRDATPPDIAPAEPLQPTGTDGIWREEI